MANEDRLRLFKAINNAGYDIGDYNDFDKRMNNAEDRQSFFQAINKAGYDIGSEDDFERRISPSKYKINVDGNDIQVSEKEYLDFLKRHPSGYSTKPTQQPVTDTKGSPITINDINQTIGQARQAANRIGNRQQRIGLDVPNTDFGRIDLGQNRKVTPGQQRFNLGTGQMDNTYITDQGNEYESREMADLEQNALDLAEWERNNPKEVLKSRIRSQINNIDQRMNGYQGEWVDADGRVHYVGGSASDEAMRNLENARHDLKESLLQMERSETLKKSDGMLGGIGIPFTKDFFNNWKNFGYAVWDRMSDVGWWKDALTGGVNDLEKASAYLKIKNKIENGIPLSDQETDVVLAGMASAKAQQYIDLPLGYTTGEITADMVPFMAQIALNPAGGLGKTVARQAVRKFGKNGIGAVSARVAARVLGNIGEAAILSNTLQAPRTIGNVLERYSGDTFLYDEDGNLHMGHYEDDENGEPMFVEGGKGALRSAYEGEISSIIENFTELGTGGNINKFLKKMATSKAGRAFGIDYLSNLIGKVGSTPFARGMRKFMERTHWDGMIEEPLEEEYGIILNSLLNTGDAKISDLWDSEEQAKIFAGTLWFGGMMSAMNTAAYPIYRRQLKKQVDQADINGQVAFGQQWDAMKNQIESIDDKEIGNFLYGIKDNNSLTNEQKAALFGYAARLKQYQGANVGEMLTRMEGNLSNTEKAINDAYESGIEAETPDELKQFSDEAQMAEQNLTQYGQEFAKMVTESQSPVETLDYLMQNRNYFTDEQIAAAADYFQKRSRIEGAMDGTLDRIDMQVEQANAKVRGNMHQGTGQVVTAQIGDGAYYVIGGDIVTDEATGMPVVTGTGGAVVVKDALTGEVSVKSPQQITVTSMTPADEMIRYNDEVLRQQLIQQADEDFAFGSPANEDYQLNDTVTLNDGEGNTIKGEVVMMPNAIDGVYVVQTSDGKALQYTADQLNRMIVTHNGQPIERTSQPPVAQNQAEIEQNQPENAQTGENYAQNQPENIQSSDLDNAGAEASAENGTGADEAPASALSRIPVLTDENGQPVLKKGKPQYQWHKASTENAAAALIETTGGNMVMARDNANRLVKSAKDKLEKIRKQEPKGEDPIELAESSMAIQKQIDDTQATIKQWQDVASSIQKQMNAESERLRQEAEAKKSEEQRQREAEEARIREEKQREIEKQRIKEAIEKDKEKRNKVYEPLVNARQEMADDPDAMAILSDTEPRDLSEWVSSLLRPHSMLWQDASQSEIGLQSELGLKRGDMQRMLNLLGTKESGAKPFGQVVLDIHEGLTDAMKSQVSDEDVRQTLLDLFSEGSSTRMLHLTEEHRIEEAREAYQENLRRAAEAETEAWAEANHLTPAERETYEDYLAQSLYNGAETEFINQIIAENEEQNSRSETVDMQPASGTAGREGEGSQVQIQRQGAAEETGADQTQQQSQQGAEAGNREPTVSDTDVPGGTPEPGIAPSEQLKPTDLRDATRVESPEIGVAEANAKAREAAGNNKPLSEKDAKAFMQMMEEYAVDDPQISLTPESWAQTFGLNNRLETPVGNVKMGESQYQKFFDKKRSEEFGMAVMTLQDPDVIFMEPSQAKEGQVTERPYSYVFVKTFIRDGQKMKYYASVTVQRDNLEVSVSSHVMKPKRVLERLMELERLYTKETLLSNSSEWHLAEQQNAVPDLLPTQENNVSSDGKDTNNSANLQEKTEKSSQEPQNSVKRLVSDDRMDELKKQLKNKIGGQLNVGVDPEILSLGAHLAVGYLERGVTKFADFAKAMIDEVGDFMRPYLKSFYNAVRDMPEAQEYADQMDSYDDVRMFDVAGFDKPGKSVDAIKKAEQIVNEQKVAKQTKKIKAQQPDLFAGDLFGTQEESSTIGKTSSPVQIASEEAKVDTNPSEAQKEAGNYQKGHIKIDGYDITIENPKGSVRSGVDAKGNRWETKMNNTYGYIRGTESVDGDHIDIFLSDNPTSGNVYVVDQVKPDGTFDEVKVMYAFGSEEEAREAYLANYSKGWKGLGNITEVSREDFKKWIESSHRKTKPFAEYAMVKAAEAKEKAQHLQSVKDEVERILKKYRSLSPIKVIDTDSDDELRQIIANTNGKEPTPEEFSKEKKALKDSKQSAAYNPVTKEIYIFADKIEDGDIEEVFFHENIHRGLHQYYGDNPIELVKAFWNTESPTNPEATRMRKEAVSEAYKDKPDDIPEEYFTHALGNQMVTGSAGNIIARLSPEHQEIINNILQNIGYDTEEETKRRKGKTDTLRADAEGRVQESGNGRGRVEPTSSTDKIEDVGEVIEGARKDLRKKLAQTIESATKQTLTELPFSKAYKKPDLKKAVEEGALREKDATFYDAWFATMVNPTKPKLTQSEMRSKRWNPGFRSKLEKWVDQTYDALQMLKTFVEASEEERDNIIEKMIEDKFPNREAQLAEIEKRKEWNKGKKDVEWGDKTTPNPLWITYEVMKQMDYTPGDKLDIPYGIVVGNTSGTGYTLYNNKGERNYDLNPKTIEEAIDNVVYMAKMKRGDTDIQHPVSAFYTMPTKSEMGETGKYRVMWGSWNNPKTQIFDSKEEADAFAQKKKGAYVSPVSEVVRRFGYKVMFRHPLTGDKIAVNDQEFDTKEEARDYMEGNYDNLNSDINAKLAKEKGTSEKTELKPEDLLYTALVRTDGKYKYAVLIDKKYANNFGDPLIIKEGFATRDEAKDFAEKIKDSVFKTYKSYKDKLKAFTFFATGADTRKGEDYRGGKDVTAEDFMNTFGFRGVQFGNWTNQRDRQMAVNQAYDSFLDLAKLLDISPKAISLNGELGIAFGARGVGGFAAHYEPGEIVINLTKTHGAGSLAHEWWHALDNYFARSAGQSMGMVTDDTAIPMRKELRDAYNNLLSQVKKSNYYTRSKQKGDYWGRMHEVTARLLAEWVDQELKKRGELNTFLSRGANTENLMEINYERYKTHAELAGKKPMSFDEFKQLDEAMSGSAYPSAAEVDRFTGAMRNIFDVMLERTDPETGKVALYQKVAPDSQTAQTDADNALRDALIDTMRNAGILVGTDAEVGQNVLDDVEGNAKASKENYFRTKDGRAYGYTYNGKIYIDPSIATSETPIHEYTHLWAEALRQKDPEKWNNIVDVLKNDEAVKPFWDKVAQQYPELTDDNDIAEEVLAQYSGKQGSERLREVADNVAKENKGIFGKAQAIVALQKMRNILAKFWKSVADVMGWKFTKAEEIADSVLSDLLNGMNPSEQIEERETPIFVSNAMRAVESIKQDKATPEQWLKMIEKGGGLKAGEDKWIGLSDWLNSQKDKKSITKQEVQDYIRQNQIQIEDWDYEEFSFRNNEKLKEYNDEFRDLIAEGEEETGSIYTSDHVDWAWDQMKDKYGDDFDSAFDIQKNGDRWELVPTLNWNDELSGEAKYYLSAENTIHPTRMDYTTQGLDNKREIALVVPTIEPYKEDDQIHFGDAGNGRAVAWVRFGETTDSDGNKVLVIDDIQSKRHQDAREKGYKGNLNPEDLEKAREESRVYSNYLYDKYIRDKHPGEDFLDYVTDEEKARFRELTEKVSSLVLLEKSGVPDAPFEKNWHELAMKRMLRYAAENGYDKIAWTTGAQQAERYDIGNSIQKIHTFDPDDYAKENGEFLNIQLDPTGNGEPFFINVDKDGKVMSSDMNELRDKSLGAIVGKELALKIMSAEPGSTIEGEGLRVGGEGMKGFYDQILPRFMDKYGKKWGVKTGEIELPDLEKSAQKMWSVDVTPEMRKSVMQGQPMFQKAPSVDDVAQQTNDERPRYQKGENALDYAERLEEYERQKQMGSPDEEPVNMARQIYEDAIRDTGDRMMIPAMLASIFNKETRERFKHKFAESWWDYSRSIKALQDAIEMATGKTIQGFEEVWRTLNAKSSIDNDQIQKVMHDLIEPLSEYVGNMVKGKEIDGHRMTLDDVEKYMNAVHGIERNIGMAMKQAKDEYEEDTALLRQQIESGELSGKERKSVEDALLIKEARYNGIKNYMGNEVVSKWYNQWKHSLENAKRNGPITEDEYIKAKEKMEAEYEQGWKYKYRNKDYSGLTALFADEFKDEKEKPTEELLEQAAKDYASEFEKIIGKESADGLWQRVKALNEWSLRKSYESGLISKDQYNETISMYKHYVPLRGWHDDYAGDVYQYISRGEPAEVLQGVLKKAYGRKSRAARIFGTMAAMANTAIIQGNKNLVAQHLLNMAMNHKDAGLLMPSEQYYQKNADGQMVPQMPALNDDMTPDEMRQELERFEADMKAKEDTGEVQTLRRKFKKEFPLHIAKWQEQRHAVRVMRNGKEYMVYILGNPRAAEAFNGLLNPNSQPGAISNIVNMWNRWLAKWQTSLSPEFLFSNFQRDVMTATTGAYIKFGNDYKRQFEKNILSVMPLTKATMKKMKGEEAKNLGGIFSLFRKYDSGTLDMNDETERLFKEFIEGGGMTGISYITKAEEYQESMEKMVRRMRQSKMGKVRKGWKAVGEGIEFLNKGIENATRFATYMTSRQQGRSIRDSIFDAKEASVNFNMKGSGAWGNMMARRLYLYVNPSMQALRMLETWYENDPVVATKEGGKMVVKTVGKRFLKTAAGVVTASVTCAIVNKLLSELLHGGDDDKEKSDWWALSEWNRYNYINIINPFGKGYFHWSIPQELRPLWAIGQIAVDMALGRKTWQRGLQSMALQLNNLSPLSFFEGGTDGGETVIESELRTMTPSFLAPFFDAYFWNRDFMGHKITNRYSFNEHDPEWQRAGDDTPKAVVNASRKLNNITGGAENSRGWLEDNILGGTTNPSALYYLATQQFGGVGSMAKRLFNLIDQAVDDEKDVELRNIPFMPKVYVSTGDDNSKQRVLNDKFWMYYSEYKGADHELSKNKKDVEAKEMTQEYADKRIEERKADGTYKTWKIFEDNDFDYLFHKLRGSKQEDDVKRMVVDAIENGKMPDYEAMLSDQNRNTDNDGLFYKVRMRQIEHKVDDMKPDEAFAEFDKTEDPRMRKELAKRISKDAGASEDPYGDKPRSDHAYQYQLQRTADDVREDAMLYALQEKLRDNDKEREKDDLSKERKKVHSDSEFLHGGRSDTKVMDNIRKNRKRLMEKYGLLKEEK